MENIPSGLSEKSWNKMKQKFRHLNWDTWQYIDGVKKIGLIKNCKIQDFTPYFIFGENFSFKIPVKQESDKIPVKQESESQDDKKDIKLDVSTINRLRHLALDNRHEVGGYLKYFFVNGKYKTDIKITFKGNGTRINLDVENVNEKIDTLFHTHPCYDEDIKYDPPSILDITSFLLLNVKNIADCFLKPCHGQNCFFKDYKKGIENINSCLKVKNSMVITCNEIYVYSISNELLQKIAKELRILYEEKDNFIKHVEELLQRIELFYSAKLFHFYKDMSNEEVNEYITFLKNIGIIMRRFNYKDLI
jgi:hypothetical protein